MADGDIDIVRSPITIDEDGIADPAVVTVVAALFTVAVYPIITITIVPPTGTQTKGLLVVAGRAIS